ncbi:hypothetical protein AKJ16_DCAP01847, partial [Drosera capensis]
PAFFFLFSFYHLSLSCNELLSTHLITPPPAKPPLRSPPPPPSPNPVLSILAAGLLTRPRYSSQVNIFKSSCRSTTYSFRFAFDATSFILVQRFKFGCVTPLLISSLNLVGHFN